MERNVQLPGLAAAAELAHGHRPFVEVVNGNLFVAKVDGSGHVVGDLIGQIGVAEKSPATEIDAADVVIQLGVVLAR
ncbi:MAG: hypothetical protein HW419_4131 [Deltaproteobacteria bacterium]|nr:hypothetical protein [Deltaproteobacteria bacterium]